MMDDESDLDALEASLVRSGRRRAAVAAVAAGVATFLVWALTWTWALYREGHIWGWWS